MSKSTLTVGLIGYQFMGKAHSNAYRQVNRYFDVPYQIRMKTICGQSQEGVSRACDTFGWEQYETDWRRVVDDPEIDIIDVSTPGDSHKEIACAAADAGKMVWCEKPIGNTLSEAQAIRDAVKKSGRPSVVFHTYRFAPAVALAKKWIDEGRLGRVYHFRAVYLQDWITDPAFPLVWRLQKSKCGSGSLGDIGSHIIDLGRYLVGEIASVVGQMETFVTERPVLESTSGGLGSATSGSAMGQVDVDDATAFIARFRNGALGTFEASRFALGRKNHNKIEINAEHGSLVFNVERMNELEYFENAAPSEAQGFRTVQVTDGVHPFTGHYWPAGHIIGYEHTFINLIVEALRALEGNRDPSPNIEDGLQNQRVMDAVERSSNSKQWVNL